MSYVFVKPIPASTATRVAVRETGGLVTSSRDLRSMDGMVVAEFIWNWGLSNAQLIYNGYVPLWNEPAAIAPLINPADFEVRMEGLTPNSMESAFDFTAPLWWWMKGPGRGGSNKVLYYGSPPEAFGGGFGDWAYQLHISGDHYRINTVGHRVVQCHRKAGDHIERQYAWTRMSSVPSEVKDVARDAARRLFSDRTIIGWDIVFDGERAYVLEGNSAPGLNTPTAERIVKEVRRQEEERSEEY